jgi:hypothetical protein
MTHPDALMATLQDFITLSKSKTNNFKNRETIIESFNLSVERFEVFYKLILGQDYTGASTQLRPAGNLLYNLCEWSYKHYLYYKYIEQKKTGIVTESEYKRLQDKLRNKKATIIYLINEIKRVSDTDIKAAGIDLDFIGQKAYSVNNGPKHLGEITNAEDYIKVLEIVRKFILTFIDQDAHLLGIKSSNPQNFDELLKVFSLNKEDFTYMLITGEEIETEYQMESLLKGKWDLVFDFNPSTDNGGLASHYTDFNKVRPIIKELSKQTIRDMSVVMNVPYWIMGRGFSDRPETLIPSNKFIPKFGKFLNEFFAKFYSIYSNPLKIVVLYDNERIINRIIEDIEAAYQPYLEGADDRPNYEIICFSDSEFSLESYYNINKLDSSKEDFIAFLHRNPLNTIEEQFKFKVPAHPYEENNNQKDVILPEEFVANISNYGQLVHLNIADINDEDEYNVEIDKENFLKGSSEISWQGLKRGFDVKRSSYNAKLFIPIQEYLSTRSRVFLPPITYLPGVGGTTLLRRVAFDFHNLYPTFILEKYIEGQTDSLIFELYRYSRMPILILIDSNLLDKEVPKRLRQSLQRSKKTIPFTIVYFDRNSDIKKNGKKKEADFEEFINSECMIMKDLLLPYIIETENKAERQNNLIRICKDSSQDEKTPFIMSLYAFEEEFDGIPAFIKKFLDPLNDEQKKYLVYLALVDFAINKPIEMQFFNHNLKQEDAVGLLGENAAFYHLVKVEYNRKAFKIRYPLFSKEILKQVSNPTGIESNSNDIIFSNLLKYILSFIEDSRYLGTGYSKNTENLLRELFITREEVDMLKSTFAPLIEKLRKEARENDIESNLLIGKIFQKLADVYPDEPHFIAHLARYYFYIEKDYTRGMEAINTAINVTDGEDSHLYHMQAMGYSARIRQYHIPALLKAHRDYDLDETNHILNDMKVDAEIAFDIFKKVRNITAKGNDINLAGYISDIELCISIVDAGKKITNSLSTEEFIQKNDNEWYTQLIDQACSLFEDCKQFSSSSEQNLLQEIEGNLSSILGDLEKTISIWEKYIQDNKSNNPKIRRLLARAYEKKLENSTVKNQEDIKRIMDLMEKNISVEPHKGNNIRIWFNAIRDYKTDNPLDLLDDAIIKLNGWIRETDTIEAHYYHFILTFIKAINGSTHHEQQLPILLGRLQFKANNSSNSTKIFEWLGKGEGIDRLIHDKDFFNKDIEQIDQSRLLQLTGRITPNFSLSNQSAYISLFGINVFFNPMYTPEGIDKQKENQRVTFGIGFSFEGPRAFNNSVRLLSSEEQTHSTSNSVNRDIHINEVVRCEVTGEREHYILCRIMKNGEPASIHKAQFKEQHGDMLLPRKGKILEAVVTNKKQLGNNRYTWELDIRQGKLENAFRNKPLFDKLKNIKFD